MRAGDHDGPTYEGVAREHSEYRAVLERLGLAVELLPPLEEYPDSIFVEDPALVFGPGAILLRPGAASRAGEVAQLAPHLRARFGHVVDLAEGFADGGDVLATPDEVLIGLSARTDRAGAQALMAALAELGQRGRIVATPPGVLHFKTGCGMLDEETVIVTQALDVPEMFGGLRRLVVPAGEEPAANVLRIRDHVLVDARCPRTIEMVEHRGFATVAMPVAEIARIDAGLSCMSLRWRAA